MPLDKRPNELTEADILDLITNGVEEGKEIDYKEVLKISTDGDKKEFLADVSSFANASGGHLVFGVSETNGRPIAVKPLVIANWDAERLKIENMVRDGISPRMVIEPIAIPVAPSGHVLVLRIPRSWTGPHTISFQHSGKFFSRNSGGKYQLDVGELRTAFTSGAHIADSIRSFRQSRLATIISGETPVQLPEMAKVVLHCCPYTATSLGTAIDLRTAHGATGLIRPMFSSGFSPRFNLDGIISNVPDYKIVDLSHSYFQLFRDGNVEFVDARFLAAPSDGAKFIRSIGLEAGCITALKRVLALWRTLSVVPPAAIMLTLLGVKGYFMGINPLSGWDSSAIDRDALIIAPEIADSYDIDTARFLRPIFNALWNAAGMSQCGNYGEDGQPLPDLRDAIRNSG